MPYKLLLVGVGGGIGSIARYLLATWVQAVTRGNFFPWGTVAVNVSGCLVIGFLAGLQDPRNLISLNARLFLMIGILGGFTTFSTFGLETFNLLRAGHVPLALANVALQTLAGVLAVWGGYALSQAI